MWIPKTPEENERDIRKEASIKGALMAAVVLAMEMLVLKLGYSKWRGTIDPISWVEFLCLLPVVLGISLVAYFWYYREAKNEERKIRSKALLCLSCGESAGGCRNHMQMWR